MREDNCFGRVTGTVDCFGGASEKLQARLIVGRSFRQALSLFSLEFSTMVVIPPWRSVGMDLSAVITWVRFGLSAAEPHFRSCVCLN